MKRLVLVLLFPFLVFAQQAQRNASFDKLNVRNTATFSGSGTHSGTETFANLNNVVYLGNTIYPCTGPGLTAALAALPAAGGIVDTIGCTGTISPVAGITINNSNTTILFGNQTWSFPSGVSAPFTVNGAGVVFQCRPQQTIFTSAALGASPSTNVNLTVFFGNNDEINDCTLQGQSTNNASNFQVAINLQANNQKARRNTITGTDGAHGFNWGIGIQGTVSGHFVEQNIISQIMTKADGQGFGIITGNSPTQGFIRGNNITFNTGGQLPIYISTSTQNFEVSDNIIIGGGTNQIKFNSITSGAVAAVSYNNVHNNILSGCTTCAAGVGLIYLSANSPHNKVHDNIIIGGTGNLSAGITIDAAGSAVGTPDFNEIENNKIELAGEYGILIIGANKNILNGNKIRNVSQQTVGGYDGIRIQGDGGSNGANANSVVNNEVKDGTFRSPLYITNTTPIPTNTVVSGNIFPSANGGIQDQGTTTQYGPNLLNLQINGTGQNVFVAPAGLWIGGQNSSGTSLPTQSITATGTIIPPTAGSADAGTAPFPWGNLWLGTAATNNFKFQPAATGQATAISLLDPKAATVAISWQGGIPCTNGELVLSAGWGTTATVTAVVGLGWSCEWTVTSSGTGQAANPTLTDTLVLPVLSASVACEMRMVGGSGTATLIDQTTLSATAPIFTFLGTPVAASTYKVYRRC